MVRVHTSGVRLLPNAITVLALCAGLSAVQFALTGNYAMAIGSIGIAAVLNLGTMTHGYVAVGGSIDAA